MERTDLIAETLPATGRENRQRGFTFQNFGNNRNLTFAKCVEAENALQRRRLDKVH